MKKAIRNPHEKYLDAFLIAFGMFLLILLPMIIYNKGIFLYFGDYNSQQIPFYQLAHRAVRSGELFWNWNTDLGANFIGSYSFYLLGSPFFWLTVPFPNGAEVYMMPLLLALKHGVAALTSYAYIRRFVKTPNAALVGSLLYAFSGFQAYNVFFNHFQDVTAFFPLLLLALEQRVVDNRRGVFALAVALMATISYFFFVGEVIFVVIYFVLRCFSKDFRITWRKFFSIAFEAVAGVLISCFLLLPAVLATLGNPRLGEHLLGLDLVLYNDRTRIIRIIQSFFMLPDVPARPNLFSSESAKWASIAGYLPMFSMAGVIAFMQRKKGHWARRLVIVSMVMAFVPVLNSLFGGMNASYYARWFYMPILVMAMMSAYAMDDPRTDMRFGAVLSAAMPVIFALVACLPTKQEDSTVFFKLPAYPEAFWGSVFITLACAATLIGLVFFMRRDKDYYRRWLFASISACGVCMAVIVGYGVSIGPYPEPYINEGIWGRESITLPEDTNDTAPEDDIFFRIDLSENYDNYAMSWGLPSMRAFQSVVPASIMEFYPTVGESRDVASRANVSKYGLRGLFSVKYYFDKQAENEEDKKEFDMPGFELYDSQNGFDIYENKYFVPMGFTYDYYISQDKYEGLNKSYNDRVLMKAIVLSKEQVDRYGDLLEELPAAEQGKVSEQAYLEDAQARAATAAASFKEDTRGFTATITLEKQNLVFFSVPYDKGFTATVDGQNALLEKVNVGFMAVLVPAGTHEIRFDYTPEGLHLGFALSGAGAVLLAVYLFLFRKDKARRNPVYEYTTEGYIPAKDAYEQNRILTILSHTEEPQENDPKGQ